MRLTQHVCTLDTCTLTQTHTVHQHIWRDKRTFAALCLHVRDAAVCTLSQFSFHPVTVQLSPCRYSGLYTTQQAVHWLNLTYPITREHIVHIPPTQE